jgi:hypothetical protein
MLSALRLVDVIRERVSAHGEPRQVYWWRVDDDSRSQVATEIVEARGALAVVPIVVRRAIFLDPNAILSDLNGLLVENQSTVEAVPVRRGQAIALVLLARGDFRLSQTGSLIRLPDWFPQIGGQEVFVRVRDILFDVDAVRFNAPEARAEDVAARLLALEQSIAARLEVVFSITPKRMDAFWSGITSYLGCGCSRDAIRDVLNGYGRHLASVADPRAYRPTLKNKASILAQMIGLVQRSNPDQLLGLARAFGDALTLPADVSARQPFIAILLRPTQPMDSSARFAHTMLATAYGGYQFLNAAAHASEYPQVSIAFLYLNSKDLRSALQDVTLTLDQLPVPSA